VYDKLSKAQLSRSRSELRRGVSVFAIESPKEQKQTGACERYIRFGTAMPSTIRHCAIVHSAHSGIVQL